MSGRVIRSTSMRDQLVLVNENDEMVGVGEKLLVHRRGLLHRAFSIFLINSHGELLLQRRALTKYHSAGLWSNTCCGHPRPGEQIIIAAQQRLKTEMGLDCELKEVGSFIYCAEVGADLIEYELDHLFIGYSDLDPILNLNEAIDWKRSSLEMLTGELNKYPGMFTFWLKAILDTQLHKFPISSGLVRHNLI